MQTESLGFLAPLSALPHLRSFGYTDGPDFVAHDIRAYFDTPPLQAATGLPKALALPGLTELRINHKAYSMVGGLRYVPYNLSAVMAMTSLRWLSVTKPYLFLTSWCFAFNGLGMLRIVYVHKVYVEALQQQFSKLVVKAGGPALVLYGWWELGLPDLCPELDD
ncbi:hypothetical protein WJX72_006438 [[Myrmecia] bisecta]|uniref:Uncharacterized protein n=1 Tax=[Myrmecia] bisecta TaxID=41462 RepID=A0AAW1Q0J7_9CHLO